MQSELTLHLDAELIAKVERWAEARNLTLSDAVATLLHQLPDQDQPLKLTPWTQQLVGVLTSVKDANGENALHEQYVDYLEDKYQ
ncbi:MAG: DUF6364 family protein [Leptolyngbya sp. BL-A-14]